MSDFGRLRSYDRFLIPVHALVRTASISWRVAIFRHLIGTYGVRGRRVTRAVHNRAAGCVAAGRAHYRKSALSTDEFKLKAI